MIIAAKYMVQPCLLSYVVENLVGVEHKGEGNKATTEEIKEY